MTDTPEKKGKKLTMADVENDEAQRSKEGIKNAISK